MIEFQIFTDLRVMDFFSWPIHYYETATLGSSRLWFWTRKTLVSHLSLLLRLLINARAVGPVCWIFVLSANLPPQELFWRNFSALFLSQLYSALDRENRFLHNIPCSVKIQWRKTSLYLILWALKKNSTIGRDGEQPGVMVHIVTNDIGRKGDDAQEI